MVSVMGLHKKRSPLKADRLIVQSSTDVRHFISSDNNITLFPIRSRNTKWEHGCIHHSRREENKVHIKEFLSCVLERES